MQPADTVLDLIAKSTLARADNNQRLFKLAPRLVWHETGG